jgi:glucose-6-phosphate 1-dehydrogenase
MGGSESKDRAWCGSGGEEYPGIPSSIADEPVETGPPPTVDFSVPLSIILFGATGDLAKKKLYPAMYQLMFGAPDAPKIPQTSFVIGYGRSEVDLPKFLEKQCVNVKGDKREQFFRQCSFCAGAYDKEESFAKLHQHLTRLEGGRKANRIFFFSVPPTVFADVAKNIKKQACANGGGFTRLILEKPFGRDSQSFAELNQVTSSLFKESELFRIDHYLGKEIVLNLVALRFGNQIYEGIWSRKDIASVQVVFKENLGTGGRGGYFDGFGIIRDIMQNHLLQVLLWFAMEPPSSLTGDAIQREKCRLLRAIQTLKMEDCFLGQFTGNSWQEADGVHKEPGYLEDKTVPPGSKCPTYAAVKLTIDNERWRGVPFLMRAGKGLDERMAEVRVTFKKKEFNRLVPGPANEFVMRIQPDEALYFSYQNKIPGWEQGETAPVVMDKSYTKAFPTNYVADAYERMFLNTAKGDRSLFVGSDELVEAWRIFTPLLQEIDSRKPQPVRYKFGVRVPRGMDEFAKKYGITMAQNFDERLANMGLLGKLEAKFAEAGSNTIKVEELKLLAKQAFDGLEPTDAQMKKIMRKIDVNNDGTIELDELKAAAVHLAHMLFHEDNHDHGSFDNNDHLH